MIDSLIIIPASGVSLPYFAPSNDIVLIDLVACTGAVDIITSTGVRMRRSAGDVVRLSEPFKSLVLEGAAQTVRLALGNEREAASHAPAGGGGGGGVTILGPLPLPVDVTDGQYPNFTAVPFSPATPSAVLGGAMSKSGPGPGLAAMFPLMVTGTPSDPVYDKPLLVGFNEGTGGGVPLSLTPGTTSGYSTQGFAVARINVTSITAGDSLAVSGGVGNVSLPLMREDGVYIFDGIIRRGGRYFVALAGVAAGIQYATPGGNAAPVNLLTEWSHAAPPVLITAPAGVRQNVIITAAVGAGSTTLLLTALAGRVYKIFGYNISASVASNLQLVDTAAAPLTAQGLGVVGGYEVDEPVCTGVAGRGVSITSSAACTLSVHLRYTETA